MVYRVITILLLIISCGFTQDFSEYIDLINAGKMEDVQKSLPYLTTQYPEHPFVLYLQTTNIIDGEEALEQYNSIIDLHPGTIASEYSIMKVGEYLYSLGLYTQAAEKLKMVPLSYPLSNNIERAVSLMKKSYLAIGEQDSVEYYIDIFSTRYPNLNFSDYDYYASLISPKEEPEPDEIEISPVVDEKPADEPVKIKLGEKPWVVQVGAFGEKKNAEVLSNRLSAAGFNIEIIERSDRIKLYLVQVVRFAKIEQAIIVGEDIQERFGLEFSILERN